jgi:hypothetical protein
MLLLMFFLTGGANSDMTSVNLFRVMLPSLLLDFFDEILSGGFSGGFSFVEEEDEVPELLPALPRIRASCCC